MRKYQLDGIRFLLFLMVFTTHYHPMPAKVEYLGYALPVFFVMSGFLITNVLLSSEDPSLTGKLKTFYIRRILRICPSYFLVIVLLIAMGTLTFPCPHEPSVESACVVRNAQGKQFDVNKIKKVGQGISEGAHRYQQDNDLRNLNPEV